MTYAIQYLLRAQRDIQRVSAWWIANRDKAPNAFADELVQTERRILADPDIVGVRVLGTTRPGVRRVLLPRTSYYLYYRVIASKQAIHVLALWHTSRQPPRSI